jgi:hypothetical protein
MLWKAGELTDRPASRYAYARASWAVFRVLDELERKEACRFG